MNGIVGAVSCAETRVYRFMDRWVLKYTTLLWPVLILCGSIQGRMTRTFIYPGVLLRWLTQIIIILLNYDIPPCYILHYINQLIHWKRKTRVRMNLWIVPRYCWKVQDKNNHSKSTARIGSFISHFSPHTRFSNTGVSENNYLPQPT